MNWNKPLKKFVGWSVLNNISVSCSSVISTNSMLSVISTPSARDIISLNYIGKDVLGQLGSLWYIWRTSKKAKSTPVKYITTGAILQQSSIHLENSLYVLKPFFSSDFVFPILGFTSLLKNISFVSIGAVSIEKLTELKEGGEMSEIYSKITVINTLSSTFGMILGLFIVYGIPSHTFRSFFVLPFFSFLSILSLRRISSLKKDNCNK